MKPFRLWIYRLLVHNLPETRCFRVKVTLLRWCGAKIGTNVRINSSAVFSGDGRLVIGDDVWIGAGDVICSTGTAEIHIGSHIDFGPQVTIITGTHKIDAIGAHIAGEGVSRSVEIGDGCWLGARAMILPGVVLPSKTLVAAGAVVTKSIDESSCLIAGVPAEKKRSFV